MNAFSRLVVIMWRIVEWDEMEAKRWFDLHYVFRCKIRTSISIPFRFDENGAPLHYLSLFACNRHNSACSRTSANPADPTNTSEDAEFLDIDDILAGIDINTPSQHQDVTFMPTAAAERPRPEDSTAMIPATTALTEGLIVFPMGLKSSPPYKK